MHVVMLNVVKHLNESLGDASLRSAWLGLTQITDFEPFVGHFSPYGRKMTNKRKKYHAAAG